MGNSGISTNLKGVLFACLTAFLWGFLPIFLKVALKYIDPNSIVWFRFTFAGGILLIYYLFTDRKQLQIFRRPPVLLIIAALALGLNYIGFLQGLNYTSPSNAQIIIQTGPILLALVGFIVYKESLNLKQIGGFIIAAIGLMLFYQNQLKGFIDDPEAFNTGFIWIEIGAVAWVLYAALQKKLVQKHPAQTLNMFLYCLPALLYTPSADFTAFTNLSFPVWLIVIFLGLNTLIAYGSLAFAFKYTEAYKVSIIVTLNPIITLITMAILSGFQVDWIKTETLDPISMVGAACVIGGAIIAVFFAKKNKLTKA
ncbi:DMT family transporter [Ancylomarina sp. 16SWW S1-10-2]|uniref:DMT family transporter n=1 Tax=Ancylomarina sp. 16SWW S1-10-2 TaxID=2499681 RepID=UPI0012ADBC0F|nr:DMT family transporter [Ancylomarina sp. 16SWW S1-10-2]MRT93103.1 DMT family transporter [Ancylomarina sp. 16SWW S1-10-2]